MFENYLNEQSFRKKTTFDPKKNYTNNIKNTHMQKTSQKNKSEV